MGTSLIVRRWPDSQIVCSCFGMECHIFHNVVGEMRLYALRQRRALLGFPWDPWHNFKTCCSFLCLLRSAPEQGRPWKITWGVWMEAEIHQTVIICPELARSILEAHPLLNWGRRKAVCGWLHWKWTTKQQETWSGEAWLVVDPGSPEQAAEQPPDPSLSPTSSHHGFPGGSDNELLIEKFRLKFKKKYGKLSGSI